MNTRDNSITSDEEATLKADWNANRPLRAEFGGDFKVYLAFKAAEKTGRVKIIGGTTPRVTKND